MHTAIIFLAVVIVGVSAQQVPLRPVVGRDCLAHLQEVLSRGLLGSWHPKCEADGTYSALQTHGSEGLSFCVDILGETIVAPVRGLKACKCPLERTQLLQNSQGLVGRFIPICDTDGTYSAMQFHASTGFVKCFTREGEEIISGRQIRSCECHRRRSEIPKTAMVVISCNDVTGEFGPN